MTSPAEAVLDLAIRRPDAPALRWRGTTIGYARLAEQARRAAAELATGCGPAAILVAKSPATVTLVLGAMLAGRPVFLPSPDTGARELGRLVELAGCQHVVTGDSERWSVAATGVVDDRPVPVGSAASPVSMLLTTSGSTGMPKLVPLGGDAIDAFTRWAGEEFGMTAGTGVLSYAPLNFDLSLLEVWATLRAGGCVTLAEPGRAADPRHLHELLDGGVELIQAVPVFYRVLVEAAVGGTRYPAIRHVIMTGEHTPLRLRRVLPSLFPGARFHNVYGCTETNDSFMYSCDAATVATRPVLPLGDPLPGVRATVVDGELWVDTPFQARAQDARYVVGDDGLTYFRTGDLVDTGEGGELTLVGRTDFQVKVRGARVCVEDIERVIAEHPDVAEVGVVALPDPKAGHRLHAVVRRQAGRLTGLGLRQHCAQWLTRAAIPAAISLVDTPLPVTSTGKVNRNQLRKELQAQRHGQ